MADNKDVLNLSEVLLLINNKKDLLMFKPALKKPKALIFLLGGKKSMV